MLTKQRFKKGSSAGGSVFMYWISKVILYCELALYSNPYFWDSEVTINNTGGY